MELQLQTSSKPHLDLRAWYLLVLAGFAFCINVGVSQDKILQPVSERGTLTFTNDGATILRSLPIDNAAAKIIIGLS